MAFPGAVASFGGRECDTDPSGTVTSHSALNRVATDVSSSLFQGQGSPRCETLSNPWSRRGLWSETDGDGSPGSGWESASHKQRPRMPDAHARTFRSPRPDRALPLLIIQTPTLDMYSYKLQHMVLKYSRIGVGSLC